MKKRVLVIHNGYPMLRDEGDKIRVLNMLQSLSEMDLKVFFLAFYKRGAFNIIKEKRKLPKSVKSFFIFTLPDRSIFLNLAANIRAVITFFIVKWFKIDIVQIETSLSAKTIKYLSKDVIIITDFHADPVPELLLNNVSGKLIESAKNDIVFALKRSNAIIVVSNNLKDNLLNYYPYQGDVFVMPCCFDGKQFEDLNTEETVRLRNLYKLNDRIVLCYLGGMHTWQCVKETIDLFIRLHQLNPKYFLCIYTNDDISLYKNQLNTVENDYLCKGLKFTEVYQYLSLVDVGFVLRRNSLVNINSSPTKTSEYMASGAMVVATQYSGDAPQIINKCGYGVVLDNVDVIDDNVIQTLNEKILFFIKNKPQSLKQIREYAFNSRIWNVNKSQLVQLYDSI